MKYPLNSLKSLQSCFFILALFMTIKADETTQDQYMVCGQYGFNCLNDKTLKFCPIVVDGVTDIAQFLECDEHFICDEDNPSFCTPKEEPNKILQESNINNGHQGNGRAGLVNDDRMMNRIGGGDKYYDGADLYYRQARDLDTVASLEDSLIFLPDDISTTESNDDSSDFTTINFTPPSPFDCGSYGFFPDSENSSLFWHCDVPLNGVGFLLRHMKCGHDRYFDKYLKSCIQEGTVRQKRKYNPEYNPIEIVTQKINSSRDCKNLKPGKYADAFDCHVYHLCSSKELSPITQLSFVCPRGTAYDCLSQTCTIAAFKRCEVKNHLHSSSSSSPLSSSNINCTSPMRFRSIDNCRSYFMCFMDNVIEIKCPKFYKFDDNSMECLPEKLANCNEFSV